MFDLYSLKWVGEGFFLFKQKKYLYLSLKG